LVRTMQWRNNDLHCTDTGGFLRAVRFPPPSKFEEFFFDSLYNWELRVRWSGNRAETTWNMNEEFNQMIGEWTPTEWKRTNGRSTPELCCRHSSVT
jgi:hypothetical protein